MGYIIHDKFYVTLVAAKGGILYPMYLIETGWGKCKYWEDCCMGGKMGLGEGVISYFDLFIWGGWADFSPATNIKCCLVLCMDSCWVFWVQVRLGNNMEFFLVVGLGVAWGVI